MGRRPGGTGSWDDGGAATLLLCLCLSGVLLVVGLGAALLGQAADLDARAQTAADTAVVAAAASGGSLAQQRTMVRSLAEQNGAVVPEGAVAVDSSGVTAAVYLRPARWSCWGVARECDPEAALRACAAAATPRPESVPTSCRSLPAAVARAVPEIDGNGTRTAELAPPGR